MVERKKELRRSRARRKKILKLKEKLAAAKTSGDKEQILVKIQRLSPWWQEPAQA